MSPVTRYQGKPLLRLLECYVLWSINQLPETEAKALKEMTPNLQRIYQAKGEWQQVISAAVQLPTDLPARIKNVWHKKKEIAESSGQILTPQQFAELFVDQNLLK